MPNRVALSVSHISAEARNELRREVRPEVQALRDRVKALEQLLNSLMEPTKTTFGATLEGEATG
jgi:hypothetical protein